MAANDDSATDPSPENDPKDNLRLPASAIASFGKREAVGIVGQADLALQEGFEVGAKRLADQASRVGILDMPVGKRFRPRMPTPTVPRRPISSSALLTSPATARSVAA